MNLVCGWDQSFFSTRCPSTEVARLPEKLTLSGLASRNEIDINGTNKQQTSRDSRIFIDVKRLNLFAQKYKSRMKLTLANQPSNIDGHPSRLLNSPFSRNG
jgi:hypothetical protein